MKYTKELYHAKTDLKSLVVMAKEGSASEFLTEAFLLWPLLENNIRENNYRKFPNKGAVRSARAEVRPYLKSRDQELSNGIWQPYIDSI